MARRWVFVCSLIAAASLLIDRGNSESPAPEQPPARAVAAQAQSFAGCSARGCHGAAVDKVSTTPLGTIDCNAASANAATVWTRFDRHATAYHVLGGDLAEKMMKRLAGPDGTPKPAWKEERCLACHATPTAADELAKLDTRHAQGFNCDACHGSTEKWLLPHQRKDFPPQNVPLIKAYEDIGLTWMNDAASRAQVCVGCHIGAPEDKARGIPLRDMNHDMIAAGHPRLTFEYATYLRNMPPHWQERDRTIADAPPVTRSAFDDWLQGQRVSQEAGLKLLASRADRATGPAAESNWRTTPAWPEFAEYDCYACHGDLQGRQPATFVPDAEKPGGLVWNRWTWSLPLRQLSPAALNDLYQPLLKEVCKFPPNAEKVRDLALAAAAAARKAELLTANKALEQLRKQSVGDLLRWDDAAQLYYAFAAAYAKPEGLGAAQKAFAALREELRFPAGANSPQHYKPVSGAKLLEALLGKGDAP